MKLKKRFGIVFTSVAASVLLAACGGSSGGTESTTAASDTDSQNISVQTENTSGSGKTITIASAEDIHVMNPHLTSPAIYAQNYIFEGLVKFADGDVQPALAESWDISDDGLTYTFHLRKGVKFSDGSEFNAQNAVKNFDAILYEGNTWGWLGVAGFMDSYRAVDNDTFEIKLTEPYWPALMDLCAVRPFRMLGDAGFNADGSTKDGIKEVVGTGPWVLKEYVENEYAVFEVNENYWGEKPKIDSFTLKIIPDSDTAISALESGEVDMIYDMYESQLMSVDKFNGLAAKDYNSFISDPVLTRILTLNTDVEPLNDINVRKAMAHAIDKSTIVQSVFGGLEEEAPSYYWSGTPYCDVGLKGYTYNVSEAESLLDASGWVKKEGKEFREKDGKELGITFYYDASNVVQTSLAQILQSELKDIGFNMQIVGEESGANIDRQSTGDFDICYSVSWGDPYDPFSTLASHTGEGTAEYYAMKTLANFDDYCKKAIGVTHTVDEKERQDLYKELLQDIEDHYGIFPISYQTNRAITNKNIDGVTFEMSNVMPLDQITVK